MRSLHSASSDRQFTTQANVAADIARFAPMQLRPIPEAAILLLTALARHDGQTYTHSLRVGRLAWQLSFLLDGDGEQAQLVFFAGLLHDIGKIDLPRSILHKPAPLTTDEWSMLKLYPDRGARLLAVQLELAPLITSVASHQERPDGMGYPRGLLLPDIPYAALRIAVADAADAMASRRSYAAPMTLEEIGEELRAGAGACWEYQAAMLVAEELIANSQLRRSPWRREPQVNTPALNVSAGCHSGALEIEADELVRFQRSD
ncbi:MAG TPA: HD domain-containing phosphohydrolase [Roseiflexaceae bacterium]|nr:HD domain-containing phosphohydrolase [Roseiflexaceae bacterium]